MKRIFSLLLCLTLAACVFAGCSNGGENSGTETQDTAFTYDSHYSNFDAGIIRSYEKFCSAVLNYETEVKFNVSQTDSVNQLFYTSFPYVALVEKVEVLSDNTGVSITYRYSQEEHNAKAREFENAVEEIEAQCGYGETGSAEYVLNLYSYITQNFKIDNTVTTVMDTAVSKSGVGTAVNGLFEYLLLQNGISASHLLNFSAAGSDEMSLSLTEFNGGQYFFNPAMEIVLGGGGLRFFAMDSSALPGDYQYTDKTDAPQIEDDTYSKLRSCSSFTVENKTVSADCGEDKPFTFYLS